MSLLSTAQGIGFEIRFSNPGTEAGGYVDYSLLCSLHVQGTLPEGMVEQWNVDKRFSRVWSRSGFLVLEMDVILAGGVSERYLRATIELWDRLLQEFVLYLRNFGRQAPSAVAGEQTPSDDAVHGLPAGVPVGTVTAQADAVDAHGAEKIGAER